MSWESIGKNQKGRFRIGSWSQCNGPAHFIYQLLNGIRHVLHAMDTKHSVKSGFPQFAAAQRAQWHLPPSFCRTTAMLPLTTLHKPSLANWEAEKSLESIHLTWTERSYQSHSFLNCTKWLREGTRNEHLPKFPLFPSFGYITNLTIWRRPPRVSKGFSNSCTRGASCWILRFETATWQTWSLVTPLYTCWLVVWTPLKNMNVNWDDYSQYMGK